MTRVLVCGGRNFGAIPDDCPWESLRSYRERAERERFILRETLDTLLLDRGIGVIIHGAARGADTLAGLWARRNLVAVLPFPADWKRDGKAAGPLRNARMLAEGNPDLVVAFPGGRGTADMVAKARAAGVEVMEVAADALRS